MYMTDGEIFTTHRAG